MEESWRIYSHVVRDNEYKEFREEKARVGKNKYI
jgi:hypothetical protein